MIRYIRKKETGVPFWEIKGEKIMKKIIKKITVMAVMSLFAATQLQTPQVNVQAADGVVTAEKTTAKQPKIYGRSGIVIDAKSGKILYASQRS